MNLRSSPAFCLPRPSSPFCLPCFLHDPSRPRNARPCAPLHPGLLSTSTSTRTRSALGAPRALPTRLSRSPFSTGTDDHSFRQTSRRPAAALPPPVRCSPRATLSRSRRLLFQLIPPWRYAPRAVCSLGRRAGVVRCPTNRTLLICILATHGLRTSYCLFCSTPLCSGVHMNRDACSTVSMDIAWWCTLAWRRWPVRYSGFI
ncbi:hypothetical protein C8Q78DRAFT_573971 [Trametes maxima]|nr:hypothetical protein C8Q78DRAFT_573971 [Trametes maxima]